MDRTLAVGRLQSDMIRGLTPAAAPQVLFPSKEGMAEQWTVRDVLSLTRAPLYRSWRSGMPQQAVTLIDDGYSGSTRNSLESM